MNSKKWVRATPRKLSEQLAGVGLRASPPTVSRILRAMDYRPRVNKKMVESGSDHPERDKQFEYIAKKKQEFTQAKEPFISVDTKKKEYIGNFKNQGRAWSLLPEKVNTHDFPSLAEGQAIPYGVYDILNNRGYVSVGSSHDTARFAVDAILNWWNEDGKRLYPNAKRLLILSDSGGSDGARVRMWKKLLQDELSDRMGLEVTVCHYPRGCSKFNPIEHRLFSYISMNWAGKVLRSFESLVGYISQTTTTTGLKVKTYLSHKLYPLKERVSNLDMKALNIFFHPVCPQWNYTITPRIPSL